jgi:hypothetical protein
MTLAPPRRALAGERAKRHPMQLVMDERNQLFERLLVARAPETQQCGDFAAVGCRCGSMPG